MSDLNFKARSPKSLSELYVRQKEGEDRWNAQIAGAAVRAMREVNVETAELFRKYKVTRTT